MKPGTGREVIRKVLHMAMGLFALALRWLTPVQAALCAVIAIVHNLWLFPHYGYKKLLRPEEEARGYSGMIGYPFIVLVLMVLSFGWGSRVVFPTGASLPSAEILLPMKAAMMIVGAAWAVLAFGDSFGGLAGMFLKGPALPWNPGKRWTGMAGFMVFGLAASILAACFIFPLLPLPFVDFHALGVQPHAFQWQWSSFMPWLPYFILAVFCAAVVETLPGQIDDNLTVPLMAWLALSYVGHGYDSPLPALFHPGIYTGRRLAEWGVLIAVNIAIALAAYFFRWVSLSACLLGMAFGIAVILGLGWPGYLVLLLFYVIANFSTYYGKHAKESRGIQEGHGGKRLSGSVFSKGFIPAVFALLSFPAFVVSLAVYAGDTAASEFGKASKGAAFSLLHGRRAKPGDVGAVSWFGSAAGLIAGLVVILAGWGLSSSIATGGIVRSGAGFLRPASVAVMALAFVFCFFLESVLNEWNNKPRYFSKEIIHLFIGGLAGSLIWLPQGIHGAWIYLRLILAGKVL
ncbi:MAG: DUF92 domain-containing protein [Acidobacteriota bacterium]